MAEGEALSADTRVEGSGTDPNAGTCGAEGGGERCIAELSLAGSGRGVG